MQMKIYAMFAVSALLLLGCSKAKDSAATAPEAPAAQEAPAEAPAAVAPTPTPTPAPSAPAEEPAAPAKKPIGDYLGAATKATVYSIKLGAGGAKKTQTNVLDAAATKAYLASLDLAQLADGPVVRCPDDTLVELADAGGALLGTIGFCKGNASFALPDGTRRGGIRASAP
jgi:hypothetical protein